MMPSLSANPHNHQPASGLAIMICQPGRRTLAFLTFIALTTATAGPARPEDGARPALAGEAGFLRENEAAMSTMMSDMAVAPTGDVDRDFAATMIPHHQGAIDMALAELRHGRNEQLKRIAQEIIVDQQQEIAAMRLALGQPLPASTPAPTRPSMLAPDDASTDHPMMSQRRGR
jgi:hypothetical protein